MKRIGLIIAVKDEASKIIADHRYKWIKDENNIYTSNAFPISLYICGIGKAYAVYGLSKILNNSDIILSMGTSGGLGNETIGSIYIVNEFVEHDMNVAGLGFEEGVTPFCGMKSPVISRCSEETTIFIENSIKKSELNYTFGRTISGDTFICDSATTEKKRTLFKAQLVDMESAAIAKIIASETNKDMIAVRFITDNANHEAAGNWQENVKQSAVLFNTILLNLCESIKTL
ncbi:MAG: hypothetical protein A2015_11680 [Spirochaetes bacterium GWF1_31_7]|nr:MAG: hypothetical protein A2Y30_15395 [Spirochaetes bacterium GWE1_32_154]OHD49079.1 MAG: hypothetical protein A2015_11680 [Spirochaetes bacterium GWF1_31_7]OHD50336.1 MAG: hypothetical protein A2Y29_13445 [Spirochaetes bacterium GWE2_31_10]HBD93878.1 hypothetical protein [Spirochaetia bacterium]HBI38815.1 hypothetical protein [Spirochaetia bacterium]